MNYLNQVLLNTITQGKTTIILVITLVALGLIALSTPSTTARSPK